MSNIIQFPDTQPRKQPLQKQKAQPYPENPRDLEPLSFIRPTLSDIDPQKAIEVCKLLEALQEAMMSLRTFQYD